MQHNNHHGHHPQQHHNNQTYNHSQSSGDGPNNNLSMDKMPSYVGVGATSSCSGGSGGAGNGDNSPSYSVPELPNIYPQSDLEAAQYSVPDTGLYNISGGSRDYSPVAGQPYPQHHHYPTHAGQPIYALNGSGGSGGASSVGSGISGGPTPYSTSVAQQYYPEVGGPPGLPHRHSANSNGPSKTVMVEPTINHNLNSGLEKAPMKDGKMAHAQCAEGSGRPMSQCDSLQDSRQSVISVQLPGNVDTEAVTWSTFNHMGGRLVLPESGRLTRI